MMNLMKKTGIAAAALLLSSMAFAEPAGTYQFDKKGAHQFVMFKISHIGYSWLYGRFNDFDGTFTVDADNPENSSVEATIQTALIHSRQINMRAVFLPGATLGEQVLVRVEQSRRVEVAVKHSNRLMKGVSVACG